MRDPRRSGMSESEEEGEMQTKRRDIDGGKGEKGGKERERGRGGGDVTSARQSRNLG